VVPADGELVNVIGDLAGVTPLRRSAREAAEAQRNGRHRQAEAA